jgi:protein TonB
LVLKEAFMNFSQNEISPVRRYGGMSVVILAHTLVAYALITGLARKMVDVIAQPIETKIIEEVKALPPPEAPPPPPPKLAAPPPPFIPPPEVQIQQPQTLNVVQKTATVPPTPAPFKPTPPAALAESTNQAAPPIPGFADLNGCKPDYPRSSLLAEEQGTVRVQFMIGADAKLISATVLKSSGFENLDRATVKGLSRCKFKAAYRDGANVQSTFTAEWVWKLN